MPNATNSGDGRQGKSWRWRVEGAIHLLVGAAQIAFPLLSFANSPPGDISRNEGLFMLFYGGVGAALIWTGLRLILRWPHPSWLVRFALYLPILACLPPMIQVARESVAKQRAINNLRQLGEAVLQYEADFKIAPKPSISSEVEQPEVDLQK